MKLRKLNNGYYSLYDTDGDIVASNNVDTPCSKKLSKQNCDEIFRVVDVRKLAREYVDSQPDDFQYTSDEYWNSQVDFKNGFNKAMEIQKDKLFTVEDMKEAYSRGFLQQGIKSFNSLMRSLQHPTEIDVEIEMETKQQLVNGYRNQNENVIGFIAEYEDVRVPKLDENGCLILKKK